MTLLRIPNVVITDSPRFAYRGLLIDVSRHFFGRDVLLDLLDRMAMHKMNVLHLHLTDDSGWRVEIAAYPKLTTVGATGDYSRPDADPRFLTKDDIRILVERAVALHIEIVPEIDLPGHSAAAIRAYPEIGAGVHTLNPASPAAFDFIRQVLTEIMAMFPSKRIHFGGDQVYLGDWEGRADVDAFMTQHGYKDLRQVEAHFARFISDFLLSQGHTPMGWDEIVKLDVDRHSVVQWWRGSEPTTQSVGYETGVRELAVKNGYPMIMSPDSILYFDYAQGPGEPGCPWEGQSAGLHTLEKVYSWEPVPDHFTRKQERQVLGVEAALWTEFIRTPEYLEFMAFPRLAALAEVAWRKKGTANLEAFEARLKTHYERYRAMGINYRQPGNEGYRYMTH